MDLAHEMAFEVVNYSGVRMVAAELPVCTKVWFSFVLNEVELVLECLKKYS